MDDVTFLLIKIISWHFVYHLYFMLKKSSQGSKTHNNMFGVGLVGLDLVGQHGACKVGHQVRNLA
jgi:hypothetical protein